MGLETVVENLKDKWLEMTVKLAEKRLYRSTVDVISGWSYYTPTYAAQELASGKNLETVMKTRVLGLAAHAIAMTPVGLLRNYVARKWNVTEDSSLLDKFKVNVVSVTPIQAVVYAGILLGGMAWADNWDWKASEDSWKLGLGLSALHSIPYGFVQDKFRTFFGVKPAIAKKENKPDSP